VKLMMLGASGAQVQGIEKAKSLGCQVVTCDYIAEAIGHQISDEVCLASTFDVEAVLSAAKEMHVDGIMTMGTDQPVYTGAVVAEALGLPQMLTTNVALSVTHKKVMKGNFVKYNLPTVDYVIFSKEDPIEKLNKITFPAVIKPVDSQGQRGIFYCKTSDEVLRHFDEVTAYSRENYILVESYYPHDEVTVSGWVKDGETYVMAITDRETFDQVDQLGICLAHTFPSKHTAIYSEEITELTKSIVTKFQITNGPIYFQMLIGAEGIKINEIACRIGGAYEGLTMPVITGFDLCEAMVQETMGIKANVEPLTTYRFPPKNRFLSVQLFFSKPCRLVNRPSVEAITRLEGVIACGFNYNSGDTIGRIDNATARAGYCLVEAGSKEELKDLLDKVYEKLQFIGEDGKNHIIHNNY